MRGPQGVATGAGQIRRALIQQHAARILDPYRITGHREVQILLEVPGEQQGGIERFAEALHLKTRLFCSALSKDRQSALASETLGRVCAFVAPARRRVARATLQLSRRSYRTRGVTLGPSLARALRDRGFAFEEYRFWVFRRQGLPCYRCSTAIESAQASSRGLYYCPSCQRRASSQSATASSSSFS